MDKFKIGGKFMCYEEPKMQIFQIIQEDIVCQASIDGGIQEGGGIPDIGKDEGGYN